MSTADLLSQDEIDALLHGVDDGDVDTGADEDYSRGTARVYDFNSQERIVRGRMPTLEMVNERFARHFRIALFNFLRRAAEISVSGIQVQKFSEFIQGLFVPTNLNVIRMSPLRGRALIVMEPRLVFTAVDNFFGGGGQFYNKVEGREFTPTEMRIIRLIIDMIFKDLAEAWKPVMDIDFEYINSEVNPQFANIVSPSEIVVISTIHVELEGGGGDINIAMPYSMIEPIRELLDAVTSDRGEVDGRWQDSLRVEIMRSEVVVNSKLIEKEMSISEVIELKKGDVIPIEMPETVLLEVEDVPVFRGKLGLSDGNYAIEITEKMTLDNI
ncbi:flagellar motor switch protein FliM [Methylomonas sp. BW4-1]|uniref:Flagellar motor switch protein FliM n=1 Tax=Methylomonas defluvii TaxID=3045149 RepID=A0ABU4UJ31_9GAMM|nr:MULTISPECIES: flagellar motor switch protein FliM [unclassified Methylomonas]MDX8128892.1 flagellar motor switch protein FliM [Methylomonas sp. OY6]NOV32225.1 flagellar motor switch protein FliM [Methylomonas sp. ZR1]PKD39782.1 flagellar motor switch protein FliM [Methylomonas sp. Kb3]QBC29405.1 flagellar motor switch protein FliM [Methylomonas sp. LW13]QSB00983.1 flagellar motor switch protein FliM [Methylomonas sp. EFPC1]